MISLDKLYCNAPILVVGDVMLDTYFWGEIHRKSPEADVPVVDIVKTEKRLGGASNVALNLKGLGVSPILVGVLGDDKEAEEFRDLMHLHSLETSGLFVEPGRKTTEKGRVIVKDAHIVRLDREDNHEVKQIEDILHFIEEQIVHQNIRVVVLQDYDKGLFSKALIDRILEICKRKEVCVAVDPKKKHFLEYKNTTLFKPNAKELKEGLGIDFDVKDSESVKQACSLLQDKLQCTAVLLTLSEYGSALYTEDGNFYTTPAIPRTIRDVSGAGDSVISAASLALASQTSWEDLLYFSNFSGGVVCEYVGVVPLEKKMFGPSPEVT